MRDRGGQRKLLGMVNPDHIRSPGRYHLRWWRSFGFDVEELNGHDVGMLREALGKVPLTLGRPTAIICHTVKGKGLPAAESNADWHHKNELTEPELDAIRVAVGDF